MADNDGGILFRGGVAFHDEVVERVVDGVKLDEVLGPSVVTDANVALQVTSGAATQAAVDTRVKDRIGAIDVRDYGAITGTVVTPELCATNTAAFAAATSAMLSLGARRLNVPAGTYPIDEWVIDAAGVREFEIEAAGAVLLIPAAHGAGIVSGDPAVWVGSSTAAADGANFLRKVTIHGLQIRSDLDPSATTRVNRRGLTLFGCQDIVLDDMWIGGFNYTGLLVDTVYDSIFHAVRVYRSGRSQPTSQDAGNPTGNRYGVEITSTIGDNSNALRFESLRVESCPLLLRVDMPAGDVSASVGPRHITFTGCKLEQREANQSELGILSFGRCTEVTFHGGYVVRSNLEIIGAQPIAYTVTSTDRAVADNGAIQKAVIFLGTSFSTPTDVAVTWFEGHRVQFAGCSFQHTTSVSTARPAFNLGNQASLIECTVVFAATVPAQPAHTPRADVVRMFGTDSRVAGLRLYAPAGPAGTVLTVAAAADRNSFDYMPVFGQPSGTLTLETGNHLDGKVLLPNPSDLSSANLAVGTPSVFNRQGGTLLTGAYTDFRGGFTGQTLLLIAGTSQTPTLTHSTSLRMKGAVDKVMAAGEVVALRRLAGWWAEL